MARSPVPVAQPAGVGRSSEKEFADGMRGLGTFPQHWGFPEGRGSSEERVNWVTRNIATNQELKRRGLDPAEVRSGKRPRTMSAREMLAKIAALRAIT